MYTASANQLASAKSHLPWARSRAPGLWLALWLSVLQCGLAGPAQPEASPPQTLSQLLRGLGYGCIPLERGHGNSLWVKATVDGRKKLLLVDTGATPTLLDAGLAGKLKTVGELGIDLVDPVLHVRMSSNAVLITELKLGGCRFQNQPAFSAGLSASGVGADGLLGCDFLIRQHAIVDCGGKELFVRGQSLDPKKREVLKQVLERSGYRPAEFRRDDSLVGLCPIRINHLQVSLMIDTGAAYTMIDDDTANRCRILWSGTRRQIRGIGRRGSVMLSVGTPETLELAGQSILFPGMSIGACEMSSWDIGPDKQAQVHGALGAEILGRSQALIDFDETTLWFVPAAERSGKRP